MVELDEVVRLGKLPAVRQKLSFSQNKPAFNALIVNRSPKFCTLRTTSQP